MANTQTVEPLAGEFEALLKSFEDNVTTVNRMYSEGRTDEPSVLATEALLSNLTDIVAMNVLSDESLSAAVWLSRHYFALLAWQKAQVSNPISISSHVPMTRTEIWAKINQQIAAATTNTEGTERFLIITPDDIKVSKADVIGGEKMFDQFTAKMIVGAPQILFFGPPGTGKTFISQALAKDMGMPLISVRTGDLLVGTYGGTERNIDALFDRARTIRTTLEADASQTRKQVMIFIDEIEQIVPDRSNPNSGSLGTILAHFLATLDGPSADTRNIIVCVATNRLDYLDPAFIRRFEVIYVGLPDREARETLFRGMLAKLQHTIAETTIQQILARPRMSPSNFSQMIKLAKGYSFEKLLYSEVGQTTGVLNHNPSNVGPGLGPVPGSGVTLMQMAKTTTIDPKAIVTTPIVDDDILLAFKNIVPNTTYDQEVVYFRQAEKKMMPEKDLD